MTRKLTELELSHKIPTEAVQTGVNNATPGILVADGQTWQDLTKEQRAQYFRNLEDKSKRLNTHTNGNSENYSRG